jgi:hypothetical protein
MVDFMLSLPTWMMIRVIGIASFLLLTAGISLGISYSFPFWGRNTKKKLYRIHSYAAIAGTAPCAAARRYYHYRYVYALFLERSVHPVLRSIFSSFKRVWHFKQLWPACRYSHDRSAQ